MKKYDALKRAQEEGRDGLREGILDNLRKKTPTPAPTPAPEKKTPPQQ